MIGNYRYARVEHWIVICIHSSILRKIQSLDKAMLLKRWSIQSLKYWLLVYYMVSWNISTEAPVSSVQSLGRVRLCDTMDCSTSGSLSITNSWSLPKRMSIESVMPSNHLILCCPLLPLPSIFPSIRAFSSEWVLHIR